MIVEKTKKLRMGDPALAESQVGPVVNEKAMKGIAAYIEKGTGEGGTLLAGGKVDAKEGFYIEPTVIGDVAPRPRSRRKRSSARCSRSSKQRTSTTR